MEVICFLTKGGAIMTSTPTPVVFIHGLWLHASSWAPWLERFQGAGYQPVAPGWPGVPDTAELARANRDSIAGHGIDDVTSHYVSIIDGLPEKPILIGHSFGGMIAEKLLGQDYGAATIAIDAAQIKGVLPLPLSSLRSTLPVFRSPANSHKAVSLTAEQFRYSFGNAVTAEESDALYERWAIPAPGKPLFEAARSPMPAWPGSTSTACSEPVSERAGGERAGGGGSGRSRRRRARARIAIIAG